MNSSLVIGVLVGLLCLALVTHASSTQLADLKATYQSTIDREEALRERRRKARDERVAAEAEALVALGRADVAARTWARRHRPGER